MASSCHGTETGNPGDTPQHQGTETGNPNGSTGCTNSSVSPNGTASTNPQVVQAADHAIDDLLQFFCQGIVRCGINFTVESCTNTFNSGRADSLMDQLGFGHGEKTLSELRENLINGTVVPDAISFAQCESDFSLTDCQRVSDFISAFDLSHLQEIMPISCSHVFQALDASHTSPVGTPTPSSCP